MKKMIKLAVVAAGVFAGISAHAASSAGWTVTGTITPSACNVTVSGTGAFDFGTTAAATVVATGVKSHIGTEYYLMGERYATVDVTCPSPTKFALHFVDAKAGTEMFGDWAGRWGLGTSGSLKIGSYNLNPSAAMQGTTTVGGTAANISTALKADGVASGSSTWASWDGYFYPNASYVFSTAPGATSAESLVNLSIPMLVKAHVNANVVNGATTDVNLNGAGTISIVLL